MKLIPILTLWICTSLTVNCQTLHGRVLSENGDPVPFVTIQFAHHLKATTSNAEGTFSFIEEDLPDTILFTAVGLTPYKTIITEHTLHDTNFSVVMLLQKAALDEIVVTGYTARSAGLSLAYDEEKSPAINAYGNVNKETFFEDTIPGVTNGPVYKTHLLTAGEVNDFTKWKMWQDFSKSDFSLLREHWNLNTVNRYSVQIQNLAYFPVAGQAVYLINATTNDTIWSAITDNTGKAELWADINSSQFDDKDYLIRTAGKEITRPLQFTKGINHIILDKPCNAAKTVDIAFMVDATGSMGDEIEYLKVELEDVLQQTFSRFPDVRLNTASVFYRDEGDEFITRHINFNNGLLNILNFIKLQHADGGGDMPEAVNKGLCVAIDSLQWDANATTKILFMVLDAPPHDEARDEMYDLMEKAAKKGIRIVPIVCSGADKSTEFLMRSISLATNGTYIFLTDDSRIGNSHIKPTTDKYKVELLNNLLQRLIQQMIYTTACEAGDQAEPLVQIPANFLQIKITLNPTPGNVLVSATRELKEIYVTDFTGKILMRLDYRGKDLSFNIGNYPNGVYLIKYITKDNQWGAEKILLSH